jgi:hypothetical protein
MGLRRLSQVNVAVVLVVRRRRVARAMYILESCL